MAHTNPARWSIGVLVIFMMFGFGFGNWLARLPATRDHLGASTFEMSLIGLVLASGALLGLILSGRTVSWLGPRRAIFFSAIGQGVFMPLGTTLLWEGILLPSMLGLAAYGFFFGTGDVAMNVSGASAERALGKPRMPLLHGGYSIGSVTAMGAGALAEVLGLAVPTHLTYVFIIIVVGCLLALTWVPRVETPLPAEAVPIVNTNTGPIQIIVPDTTTATGPATAAVERYNPWRDPRILLLGFMVMSVSLTEGTATDWLPLALADNREFSNASAALALGVFYAAMMLTRIAGSWLLTRFGRVVVLRASAVCAAIAILTLYLLPFGWVGYVCAALWGIGGALGFPIAVSAAADDPERAVQSVATVSTLSYASFLIGPMLIGIVGEYFGLLTAFLPLIAVLVFVLFAASAARERGPEAHSRA